MAGESLRIVYEMTVEPFNYAAVFGTMLGIAFVVLLENMASNAVTFVRGWRT